MKVTVIGTGYVGLVSGTCFSEFGHDVVCVDKDQTKVDTLNRGEIPIYEPGLKNMVARNREAGRLSFTNDLSEAMKDSRAVFIAVGTPSRRGDGHADLQYVFAAVDEIADNIKDFTLVVTKSTVPVGTGGKIRSQLSKKLENNLFSVASNPEFLREGAAIEDFMRPDRVICGIQDEKAQSLLKELYRPLFLNETPVLFTSLETAELIKYAANAFLATKISFINEMADLCEAVGADVQDVARGIGLDNRIGSKFLHAGPGYGGSCFPKDTRALIHSAQDAGVPMQIVEAVVKVNDNRKKSMADKIIKAMGDNVKDKKIAILGLTFKPNTDDMRDSPALDIIPALQAKGASISAYDPKGMDEAAKMLAGVTFCKEAYETMENADGLVIVTEWNQFRALDLARVKSLLKDPILVDLRNIYARADLEKLGFIYTGVGRTVTK